MKKLALTQLGADDAESLNYFAERIEKEARIFKWVAITMGVLSIPLCLIIIGFPMIIIAICMYYFGYTKIAKKAQMFREHVNNDTELSAA